METPTTNKVDPLDCLTMTMQLLMNALVRNKTFRKLTQKERSVLLLFISTGFAGIITLMLEREAGRHQADALIAVVTKDVYEEFYEQNSRKKQELEDDDDEEGRRKKRLKCKHDHERAWMCIQQDYLGPTPIYTDKQFEEVYRLTKGCVERLIVACCKNEPSFFGRHRVDATGKPGIRVECKVLGILKCIAFGCSGVAFRDYHQMARNTFSENLKAFFRAILADDELRGTYLRAPTRADARRVEALHKKKHGVAGMLLSGLDCLHVFWKNCPVGQQCHFKNGKNKMSSVVLEGGVDYNCWFWHASCGHPGTNNDITIWDQSDLQKKFISEGWSKYVDFEFKIDGQKFNKLWCLVDGIYPALARFVKTLPVAVGETTILGLACHCKPFFP